MDQDPASRVPPALLQHLHLISQFRYPIIQTSGLDYILENLMNAPHIVRNVNAFSWSFLDAPQNGTMFLVYQSPHTQNRFASDGYIWADQESFFQQQYQGHTIEMLVHNCGYPYRKEENNQGFATHSRRRYRLVSSPSTPCNPNLWIVHYQHSQQTFPIARIPLGPQDQQSLQQRMWLQQQGTLMENKFMLEDQANWPTVTMPHNPPPHGPGPVIGFVGQGRAAAQNRMAQAAYASEHPPSKRARHNAPQARGPPGAGKSTGYVETRSLLEIEEEEFKDLHDYLTPREISQTRFTQHHEWMEEVYSSYPTFAIKPVSLGLGRKGDLAPLTNGYFDPPRPPTPADDSPKMKDADYDTTMYKPLEPGQAEEFYVRANNKINQLRKEMEAMKLEHEKRMESFARIKYLKDAEKRLRSTVAPGDEGVNNDAAKIDGGKTQVHDPARGDATIAALRQMDQIDTVAREMESTTGMKIGKRENVRLVTKGGLVEETASSAATHPKTQDGTAIGNANGVDLPSSLFDDFLEPSAAGSVQTSAKPSASPAPVAAPTEKSQPAAGQANQTGDDWVMVNKPDNQATNPGDPQTANAVENNSLPAGNDALASGTPDDLGDDLVDFGGDGGNDTGFETAAFDDAIDFGDLDNTGDDDGGMDAFEQGDGEMINVGGGLDNAAGLDLGAETTSGQPQIAERDQVMGSNASGKADENLGDETIGGDLDVGEEMDSLMEDTAFGDAFGQGETGVSEGDNA